MDTNMSSKICWLKISPPCCWPSVKHCFLIPINRSRIKHTCARKKPQTHYVRTSSRYVGPSDGWACWRCQLIWAWDGVGGWGRGIPPSYHRFTSSFGEWAIYNTAGFSGAEPRPSESRAGKKVWKRPKSTTCLENTKQELVPYAICHMGCVKVRP